MKRFVIKIIKYFCLSVIFPLLGRKSRLDPETARKKLMDFSPKPNGHIIADNDLQEPICDLQIIIPAYNAEQFLEACMDSVLSQKTQYTFKVLLIDDGSTDGTAEIADRYLGRENVIVIHQENRGFSGARNRGLETLFGKYIMFVDSDDMLCPGAIETLLREAFAHDSDIVQGGMYYLRDGKTQMCYAHSRNGVVTAPVGVLRSYPVAKVFKAECFLDFAFPEGFWYEDSIFTFLLYPRKTNCYIVKDFVYLYTMNPTSISHTGAGKAKCADTYWITELILQTMEEWKIPADRRLFARYIHQVVLNHKRMKGLPGDVQESAFVLSAQMLQRYFAPELIAGGCSDPVVQALTAGDWGKFRVCCRLRDL